MLRLQFHVILTFDTCFTSYHPISCLPLGIYSLSTSISGFNASCKVFLFLTFNSSLIGSWTLYFSTVTAQGFVAIVLFFLFSFDFGANFSVKHQLRGTATDSGTAESGSSPVCRFLRLLTEFESFFPYW